MLGRVIREMLFLMTHLWHIIYKNCWNDSLRWPPMLIATLVHTNLSFHCSFINESRTDFFLLSFRTNESAWSLYILHCMSVIDQFKEMVGRDRFLVLNACRSTKGPWISGILPYFNPNPKCGLRIPDYHAEKLNV